jgi:hypothetical protein
MSMDSDLVFVKVAAFVDELVKIAVATGDTFGLEEIVPYLNSEQENLLKQAGMGNWLSAAKAGAGRVGSALAGAGQKAVGAIQGMGAGGAQARMMAAGAEHEGAKALMRNSQGFHGVAGAMKAPAPATWADKAMAMGGSKGPVYNPQAVQKGLMAQDLAQSHAGIAAATPRAVPAGQVRYNPLDVSRAAIPNTAPRAIPAMGPVHEPIQTPVMGVRDHLRAMNPFAGMANTFRGAMQPSAFAAGA